AATATAPSTVLNVVFCSPAMMIDPTTAIAEIALVSDISGVCSRRDTFWMTWKPQKVASMNTKSIDQKSRGAMEGDYIGQRAGGLGIGPGQGPRQRAWG